MVENCARLRPTRNNRTGQLEKALEHNIVYKLLRGYSAHRRARERATAATDGLITRPTSPKMQKWLRSLDHANIVTTPYLGS
jgi:hypothetical protein